MDISEAVRFFSTIYVTPLFHQKNSMSGHYGKILCKENKNTRVTRQAKHNAQYQSEDDTFKGFKDKYEDALED